MSHNTFIHGWSLFSQFSERFLKQIVWNREHTRISGNERWLIPLMSCDWNPCVPGKLKGKADGDSGRGRSWLCVESSLPQNGRLKSWADVTPIPPHFLPWFCQVADLQIFSSPRFAQIWLRPLNAAKSNGGVLPLMSTLLGSTSLSRRSWTASCGCDLQTDVQV